MNYLRHFNTPQLELIHQGKVRDSFRINDDSRMIVVTDRISCFDKVLKSTIPHKGAVLNGISNFWFEKTKNIIGNHMIDIIDPNINLVKEAHPIRIEMIVRGYLTGSMWRKYQKGKREFSGVKAANGLKKNQKFPEPILTPTTKEESDREITPEDIVKEGWTSEKLYSKMVDISLKLFTLGSRILREKGIILVDTKYEFGLINDKLILIDEIHTPDSSRFWSKEDYDKNPEKAEQIDKEFVRQWLLNNKFEGKIPDELPDDIIEETSKRYLEIFKIVTGKEFIKTGNIKNMIYNNLIEKGIIKDGFVSIIMGSPADLEHCKKIKAHLDKYDIYTNIRVVSAHKNGERIPEIAEVYNNSIEPGAVIAVAGRSNGLGGALAANLAIPVINCPPFKDKIDMMMNINSSLIMPSNTPAMTVIDVSSAALAALRCLNLKRLKEIFKGDIRKIKEDLKQEDENLNK